MRYGEPTPTTLSEDELKQRAFGVVKEIVVKSVTTALAAQRQTYEKAAEQLLHQIKKLTEAVDAATAAQGDLAIQLQAVLHDNESLRRERDALAARVIELTGDTD